MKIRKHPERFFDLESLGSVIPDYSPNFEFEGSYIDSKHAEIGKLEVKGVLIELVRQNGEVLEGWLRRDDALKLYELGYFSEGDILELGCYRGLSTCILGWAARNSSVISGKPKFVGTIDINPINAECTEIILKEFSLDDIVKVCAIDAADLILELIAEKRKFGFVFIDHSHAYNDVALVCNQLPELLLPGGFCAFHDFIDSRNKDPEDTEHKVYQAVVDCLANNKFEFIGIYGCTSVYRLVG